MSGLSGQGARWEGWRPVEAAMEEEVSGPSMKGSKRIEVLNELVKIVPNGSLEGEGDDMEVTWETPDGMVFTMALKRSYRSLVEDSQAAVYLMEVLRLKRIRFNVNVGLDGFTIGDPQALMSHSFVAHAGSPEWIMVEDPSFPSAVAMYYVRAVRRLLFPPPVKTLDEPKKEDDVKTTL